MAFSTPITSAALTVTAAWEAFQLTGGGEAIINANPRALIPIHINLNAVGTTDNFDWRILAGMKEGAQGDWDAVTDASNLDLETTVHPMTTDDEFAGLYVVAANGGEDGEWRLITASTASDDGITVDHAFSGAPDAGELYDIYRMGIILEGVIVPLTTPTIGNPQHVIMTLSGYEYYVILGKRTGSTDAHIAYMTSQNDGVSA